jgi:hypothetical protein
MASLLALGLDEVVVLLPADPAEEDPPLLPQAASPRVSVVAARAVRAIRGFMSFSDFVDPYGFSQRRASRLHRLTVGSRDHDHD